MPSNPWTAVHPASFLFQQVDEVFDLRCLAQFKEIGNATLFTFHHVGFIAVVAIPSYRMRTAFHRQGVDQLPQGRHSMGTGALFAGTHLHIQTQTQSCDPVSVVGMTGTPGFMRVVSDFRTFLMTENRLHCGVDIQHPGFVEQAFPSLAQVLALPLASFNLFELLEIAAGTILADDFFMPSIAGLTASNRSALT